MRVNEAIALLDGLGLPSEVQQVASDEQVDRVVDQRPDAGSVVPPGSLVTLVVSRGPDLVEVPDLRGRTFDLVRPSLEEAGFRIVLRERRSNEGSGTILDQSPDPGQRVRRGAELRLTVAR
jgi:serine/threonine-protein kinase